MDEDSKKLVGGSRTNSIMHAEAKSTNFVPHSPHKKKAPPTRKRTVLRGSTLRQQPSSDADEVVSASMEDQAIMEGWLLKKRNVFKVLLIFLRLFPLNFLIRPGGHVISSAKATSWNTTWVKEKPCPVAPSIWTVVP